MRIRKYQRTNVSTGSSAQSKSNLQASRPFAPQSQPDPESKSTFSETKEKLVQHQRTGHSLSKMKLESCDFEPPHPIQTQLEIGLPGDKYELEADRVAGQVVSRLHAPQPQPILERSIQRNSSAPNQPVVQPGAATLQGDVHQFSPNSLLQAKLMTGKKLAELTGVDRRNFLKRGFKAFGGLVNIGSGGSSYDDILGLLSSYEKLEEGDVKCDQKAKRLSILTDLEKKIFAWYQSSNRKKDENNEVVGKSEGEIKKIEILQELMYQVVEERDNIASLTQSNGKDGDSIESSIEKTKNISSDTPEPEVPEKSESEAKQVNKEQKTFWSKFKDGFSKSWHYTFGNEFYPKKVVPLHMDFVSEYDVMRSAELLELAMKVEKNLLKDGVDQLKATTLAYQYLPIQLRPRSPEPEEKVVLKVKLQIFKESLKKTEKSKDTSEKIKDVTDKVGTANSVLSGGSDGLEKISVISKDLAETNTGVGEVVGGVGELVGSFADIFSSLSKSSESGVSETERTNNEEKALSLALTIEQGLLNLIGKINDLLSDSSVPGLEVLSGAIGIFQNLIKGAQLVIRYVEEGKLNKDVEAIKSGLIGALKSTAKRSRFLAISSGAEIIIGALDIMSTLFGAADGGITKTITTILKVAKKVVETVESSYAAGLSQESQMESESGIEGSSKKVLESSTKWGVTAIILEAKDGNKIAIKKLELFGIKSGDIDTLDVEVMREIVMEKLERTEDDKTLRQKIPIFGGSVKG